MNDSPELYADEDGVWRRDPNRDPFGIHWDEVYRVSVGCIDTIIRHDLLLSLDWSYGEFVEFNDEWPGFWKVAAAISQRLPGIDESWIDRAKGLKPGEGFAVWSTSERV